MRTYGSVGFQHKSEKTSLNYTTESWAGYRRVGSIEDFANTSTETIDLKKHTVLKRHVSVPKKVMEALQTGESFKSYTVKKLI